MKKRLFVTGLSGFVGQHIQSRLQADTSEWELLPVPDRYDLAAPQSLEGLWPQMPDAVIHLAGQTFVPEAFRDPAGTLNINLLGTLNLLQALKARGFTGTFLYVSSGDVYGQVAEEHLPITELHPPCPRNPYAVSKLSAEFLSLQWGLSEGWPVLVARPFNHIGSGQKDSFVIAGAAHQIAGSSKACKRHDWRSETSTSRATSLMSRTWSRPTWPCWKKARRGRSTTFARDASRAFAV